MHSNMFNQAPEFYSQQYNNNIDQNKKYNSLPCDLQLEFSSISIMEDSLLNGSIDWQKSDRHNFSEQILQQKSTIEESKYIIQTDQELGTQKQNYLKFDTDYDVRIGENCIQDLSIMNSTTEQLTIYSLFESKFSLASSKVLFKSKLTKPTWNYDQLIIQFNELSYMCKCFANYHAQFKKHLKSITSLKQILKQFQQYHSSYDPWKRLIKTLTHIEEIIVLLRIIQTNDPLLQKPKFIQILQDVDVGQLQTIITQIISCLNPSEDQSILIKQGVNQELDSLKQTQQNIAVILQSHLNDYLNQLQSQSVDLSELNFSLVKYKVQGFLVKVTQTECDNELLNLINSGLVDWCFTHQQDDELYFSNSLTSYLNMQYLNLDDEILILQQKILIEISNQMISCEPLFNQIETQLIHLDYNLTLTQMMNEFQLTIPDITKEPICKIENGRHLLSEQALKNKQQNSHSFVENNFNSTDKRTTIITGPNYSGKSVYIKQIAVIIYLAHAGLPVPAKYAKIGLVDQIETLFAGETQKSIHQRQSDSELICLASITNNCTNRSLVVLDELGKNFKFDIGSALFCSTILYMQNCARISAIENLYNCKSEGTFILAATHYHAVLSSDFKDETNIQFSEMQVTVNDLCSLVFQYKIQFKQQLSQSSLALEVARDLMDDEEFFQRSKEILNTLVKRLRTDDFDQGN